MGMSRRARVIRRVMLFCTLGVGISATISGAHDDDWRKLADRHGPFVGPAMTQANGGSVIAAGDFPSENINLLAWIPLSEMPNNQAEGNDCWGYVSPSGREYAIMGVEKGFIFYEITDPGNPVQVAYVVGPASSWHDVKVIGDHAYGVSEGGAGIQVMDLSDIDSGVVTHVGNVQDQGHSSTHNIVANPDSGYLYLVGGNVGNGGLVAVSLADPDAPKIVGGWTEMYVHDAYVQTFDEGPYAGREIAFCAAGFNAGWDNSGLRIIDVTDKDNMFKIGEIQYPGAAYAHQCWISEDNTLLYLDDELDEDGGTVPSTTTYVFDITDLSNPTLVSTFSNGLPSIDHNQYVKDGYTYQANYRSGLRVWDLSDPLSPTEVAYFDTYPQNDSANFNGAWSTYPYFPSGTVIVSDIDRGFFVLDVVIERLAFAFPQGLPETLDPGTPTPVSVEVTEDGAELVPSSVKLIASVDGGAFTEIPMTGPGGPGIYTADLPAGDCYQTVEYYFTAQAANGDLFKSPNGAPNFLYSADVITGQQLLAEDELEAPSGWTVGDAGDNATTGIWERANPQGTDAQPEDDHTPSGTLCYVTGASSGGDVGANDVDNGKTTLFSPIYDLSGVEVASISYWRWYSNDAGGDPNDNVFVVSISDDAGASWTNVETVGPGGGEVSGGWIQHSFYPNELVDMTSQIKLRFVADDNPNDGEGSIIEAAIDDLEIDEILCKGSGCAADFNGDGSLNILDFVAFQSAFQAGEDDADFNGDGQMNILDFVAFQAAFQVGCP